MLEELSPSTTQAGADIPPPPQAVYTNMDPSQLRTIRCSRSGIQRWRAILREWRMEQEEFEAIPDIATLWEDPATTYPKRAWFIIRAFYDTLSTNVSIWIHKLRKKGLSTLAAHGTSLMGCDGANAKPRQVRNEKLLLNREAWNVVDNADKFAWYTPLSTIGHLTQTISDPRISCGTWDPMGSEEAERKSLPYSRKGNPSSVYKT